MSLKEINKWWQTIKITWSNMMAYKLNFLLMVLLPAVVNYFVKYNIWDSIYSLNGVSQIHGYDRQSMLNYQAWAMVVAFLGLSYQNSKVSEDIRMGRISAFLLYPFQFWKYHVAGFIGFQATQLFVSTIAISTLVMSEFIMWPGVELVIEGVILSLLVGLLWFLLQFSIALLSFWMDETWVLRVMLILISQFFAGAFIPIDLYPIWLQTALMYSPFPYLIFIPIKIFMGEYQHGFIFPFTVIMFWISFALLFVNIIWNRGVKLYTAAGI